MPYLQQSISNIYVIIIDMKITNGRLNRRSFAIGFILFGIMKLIAAAPAYVLFFLDKSAQTSAQQANILYKLTSMYTPTGIIFHVLSILIITWSLQIYIRRFHDLGKSGGLAIVILLDFIVGRISAHYAAYLIDTNQVSVTSVSILQIPYLFSLAAAIMVIYLIITKGTSGENKYGPETPEKVAVKNILLNR